MARASSRIPAGCQWRSAPDHWIPGPVDAKLDDNDGVRGREMKKADGSGARKAAIIILLLVGAANLAYGGYLFFTEGRVELPLFIAGVITGGFAAVLGATGKASER
jgi:hypothetical protein